ncbi:inorganic phosphate transporter [Rudanella paleaurantiibacter]|uniref:Phosphate transporter n=1 Tax=Rudanella paleaurantiibacter TaxID=2614655 RepID=A0A7J5TWY8_9BACT|nr:inorganic phosphate transporter [Rudanella paleaurantiibacter]KAB7729111.1 inorganic phosphate transporter [Rudanella paleaurantiibacter]
MFGLETGIFILLAFCILAACVFEFINGFHDTANAVATVIYTNSLQPTQAVVWSGFMNFLGVITGGVGVGMSIVNLLPVELLIDQNVYHSIAMVLALLFSAIIWNFGTWYFGLPASSSHTLIGAIIGVGLGYAVLPDNEMGIAAVNWDKAKEVFAALFLSPLIGFSLAVVLMFVLRRSLNKEVRKQLFDEPQPGQAPPAWVRGILIMTCTLVSFFHGRNDGQKGIGLVMLILIGILPAYFAVDNRLDVQQLRPDLTVVEQKIALIDTTLLNVSEKARIAQIKASAQNLEKVLAANKIEREHALDVRQALLTISSNVKKLNESEAVKLSDADRKALSAAATQEEKGLRKFTDHAPFWVILMISLSLGFGTMIGWKRIVVTVGEKIGKSHLTYAQGASAELVAAVTIGMASAFKVPVSTTHSLSSGIAGAMVASKGIKNLQAGTIQSIMLAWLLTLPVAILLSATLFVFFRWLL